MVNKGVLRSPSWPNIVELLGGLFDLHSIPTPLLGGKVVGNLRQNDETELGNKQRTHTNNFLNGNKTYFRESKLKEFTTLGSVRTN